MQLVPASSHRNGLSASHVSQTHQRFQILKIHMSFTSSIQSGAKLALLNALGTHVIGAQMFIVQCRYHRHGWAPIGMQHRQGHSRTGQTGASGRACIQKLPRKLPCLRLPPTPCHQAMAALRISWNGQAALLILQQLPWKSTRSTARGHMKGTGQTVPAAATVAVPAGAVAIINILQAESTAEMYWHLSARMGCHQHGLTKPMEHLEKLTTVDVRGHRPVNTLIMHQVLEDSVDPHQLHLDLRAKSHSSRGHRRQMHTSSLRASQIGLHHNLMAQKLLPGQDKVTACIMPANTLCTWDPSGTQNPQCKMQIHEAAPCMSSKMLSSIAPDHRCTKEAPYNTGGAQDKGTADLSCGNIVGPPGDLAGRKAQSACAASIQHAFME